MPTLTESPVDYAALAPTVQEPSYKDKLSPKDRQEYQSRKARWRDARAAYYKDPATAPMICAECMKTLDTDKGFGVHLNVVTLFATLKCLSCMDKSSRANWFMIVKEI